MGWILCLPDIESRLEISNLDVFSV
jgi:hypothetical protein